MFSRVIESRLRMAKAKRVRMLRPMTRARHQFALIATYGLVPTARNKFPRSLARVRKAVKRYRKQWLHVLEQLCLHELWSPVSGISFDSRGDTFDESKFDFAFGLCTRCLPLCVKWQESRKSLLRRKRAKKRKINAHIIPCRKTHFCPACFGSLSEQQYRHVKQVVNTLNRKGTPITVTSRVTSVFVPAATGFDPAFEQQAYLTANVLRLREAIAEAKASRQKLHKRLQRNTLGSYWRLIAVPVENGWRLETRWLFITSLHRQPPMDDVPNSVVESEHVVHLPERLRWATRLTESDADELLVDALLPFAKYPRELLTGNIDLIAAWLNALVRTRLLCGTGLLEKSGRSLLEMHKRQDKLAAAKKRRSRGQKKTFA